MGWRRKLIIECCYLLIMPPPLSIGNMVMKNEKTDIVIGINSFITCLMLGRMYLFIRLASSISKFQNDQVVQIW